MTRHHQDCLHLPQATAPGDLEVEDRQVAQVLPDVGCGRPDRTGAALAAGITRLPPTVPGSGAIESTTDPTRGTSRAAEATVSHQERR